MRAARAGKFACAWFCGEGRPIERATEGREGVDPNVDIPEPPFA